MKQDFLFPKIFWKPREEEEFLIAEGIGREEPAFFCKRFDQQKSALWEDYPEEAFFHPQKIRKEPFSFCKDLPLIASVSVTPDFPTWRKNILLAKEKIREGIFQKVVLARKMIVRFLETPDPVNLFGKLLEKATNSYGFYFQPKEGTAFFGISPERLYKREKSKLFTEALAGTRKRGDVKSEDDFLKEELLHDVKERQEFGIVRDYIEKCLEPFVEKLTIQPLEVLQTRNVQHLYSRFLAKLKEGDWDQELIRELHPTPAILGFGKKNSLQFLQKQEPFVRGLYAGCLGWVGKEKTEIAVGIRSALLKGKELHIFAGTGIVEKSDPLKEWEELEAKILPFKECLCL